ncbi:MAG: hypothetical protein RL757_2834 [Bacteroidota bacterium]|jgi:tetratricopeptide (TPR) repeat protein
MRQIARFLFLISLTVFVWACASQRKKDEAKGLKKAYLNMTAYYNGYFNANELVNQSVAALTLQHRDNFNQLLNIYPYVDVENATAEATNLDKAIEKLAVIATARRASHWTDDAYFLIGKAQFLKKDYEAAQESFMYLTEIYNPDADNKINRKRNRAEADKARKEAAEERRDESKARVKEREREQQKLKDEKEKELKDRAKQKEKDREELKNTKKEDKKTKAEELAARNEARRKENERKAAERKAEREARIKAQKEPKKDQDTGGGDLPDPNVKKTPEKVEIIKTGINDTPVMKTDSDKEKAKKDKAKPKRYFFKHRPVYQEGMVWLARTYAERKMYGEAQSILEKLERDPKTFKDIKAQATVALAQLQLQQGQYTAAQTWLEKALKRSKRKREKVRIAYVLAQLYKMEGSNEKAYAAFDKVLKYGPAYEMEFNAKLNKTLTGNLSESEAVKTLLAMSKDRKNQEYNDQIYFMLAQIALKNKKRDEAIAYLQQSLAVPSQNIAQKSEAYYQLAKMYNEVEDFVNAKKYFDSTATVMSKLDPRAAEAERFAANLNDIAKAIETIALQDSLIKIAALSPSERRKMATKIKKQREDAADQAEKAKLAATKPASRFDDNPAGIGAQNPNAPPKSNFFAYNPELVKRGKREFEKKWGTRKLEDNWRRSNKRGGSSSASSDPKIAENSASEELSDSEMGKILFGVPENETEVAAANKKVEDALFQLGTLYHDKVNLYQKSVETLEKLLKRYPESKKELESFYYLYLAHTSLKQPQLAQFYFDKILEKYPKSEYAAALKNPTGKSRDTKETVDKYYDATFAAFKKGDYKAAAERIAKSEQMFGINNSFRSKFALLGAMCTGNLMGKINYIAALKDVVGTFPNTPEEVRAKEMLRILEGGITKTDVDKPQSVFTMEEDKPHYIFVVLKADASMEEAQVTISDFNTKYNRLDDIKITNIYLGENVDVPVVMLRSFKNKAAALAYIKSTSLNERDFLAKKSFEIYAVSQKNYAEVLRQRKLDDYKKFYELNY